MAANAEDASLKGTVTDAQGEPLIGAMVHVEGTSIAAATDIDGNFSLTAPVGKTLKVSYVGFDPVSVKVTAGKPITGL